MATDWRLASDEEKQAFLDEEKRVLASESGQEQQRRQSQSSAAPRRLSAQDREAGGALVDHLQAMGITVSTDSRENRRVLKEAQKDQSEAGKVRHFKTEQGESYASPIRVIFILISAGLMLSCRFMNMPICGVRPCVVSIPTTGTMSLR